MTKTQPRAAHVGLIGRTLGGSRTGKILTASAATLAVAALYNIYRSRQVERQHPPAGRFIDVDGVRLHYLERGEGTPVVLLHGNVVTAEDWILSGVFERLAERHRVIAFDRPGYGYSARPQGSPWTAAAQADLLRRALTCLGIEHPIVVGHSWGANVALALALAEPTVVRGLVLLAGYYHPTLRADALLVAPVAVPVLGDLLRYTVSPLLGAALLPLLIKGMFAPLSVPGRFAKGFAHGMAVRPSQIRAEAQDGATMAYGAASMRKGYPSLCMPVVIMAGSQDRVVDVGRHAIRLHEQIPHSDLQLVPGAGHMVHHAVPEQIVTAIATVADRSAGPAQPVTSLVASPAPG
ncbi:alpha/beta fold hydrolase [Geminicoccus flavidas]|uniref:alpha/beta fold hydrolase n=1 Tax=Geminicoccus flavidas TaxID=2506407 RepID=UPI00190F9578|nr:alpha/beta hydrolase [Geminicoccus flavidas]